MAVQSILQDASQRFWLDKTNANHRYASDEWFAKYADEILGQIPCGGTLVDIGCGSCQVTVYLAGTFDRVVAIDTSPAMLAAARERIAKLGIDNTSLRLGSAFELTSLVENGADVVLSYALVQYFTEPEMVHHLQECRKALKPGGVVYIGLIPDVARQAHYYLGYLIPTSSRLRRLPPRIRLLHMRAKGRLRRDPLWDGVGNWFSKRDITRLAKNLGLVAEFHDAAYSDYRFHAVLRESKEK
jgi:ubiquinone/menaquinone biosynthesis C-methylase UbiE